METEGGAQREVAKQHAMNMRSVQAGTSRSERGFQKNEIFPCLEKGILQMYSVRQSIDG